MDNHLINSVQIDCISTSLRYIKKNNEDVVYFDFYSKLDNEYKKKCYYSSFSEFIIQLNIKNLFSLNTPIGEIIYKLFISDDRVKIGLIINNIDTITRDEINTYVHYIERHIVGFNNCKEFDYYTNNKPLILIKMDQNTNLVSMD